MFCKSSASVSEVLIDVRTEVLIDVRTEVLIDHRITVSDGGLCNGSSLSPPCIPEAYNRVGVPFNSPLQQVSLPRRERERVRGFCLEW